MSKYKLDKTFILGVKQNKKIINYYSSNNNKCKIITEVNGNKRLFIPIKQIKKYVCAICNSNKNICISLHVSFKKLKKEKANDKEWVEPYIKMKKPEPYIYLIKNNLLDTTISYTFNKCHLCIECLKTNEYNNNFRGTNYKIPHPKTRNLINKFTQQNAFTVRLVNQAIEYIYITDGLLIIKNQNDDIEDTILKQLENIDRKNKSIKQLKKKGDYKKLTHRYVYLIINVLIPMLNTSLENINNFKFTYDNVLVIIRVILFLIYTYPNINQILIDDIYSWIQSSNNNMKKWIEIIWISSFYNIDIKKNKIIEKYYSENNDTFAYANIYSNMLKNIISKCGIYGIIKLMDSNNCNLPIEYYNDLKNKINNIQQLQS